MNGKSSSLLELNLNHNHDYLIFYLKNEIQRGGILLIRFTLIRIVIIS